MSGVTRYGDLLVAAPIAILVAVLPGWYWARPLAATRWLAGCFTFAFALSIVLVPVTAWALEGLVSSGVNLTVAIASVCIVAAVGLLVYLGLGVAKRSPGPEPVVEVEEGTGREEPRSPARVAVAGGAPSDARGGADSAEPRAGRRSEPARPHGDLQGRDEPEIQEGGEWMGSRNTGGNIAVSPYMESVPSRGLLTLVDYPGVQSFTLMRIQRNRDLPPSGRGPPLEMLWLLGHPRGSVPSA